MHRLQGRPVVAKAKEFIDELRGRKPSLDAAAATIGVSPIHVTQAFKAPEGIPLYRHYLNVRLSQALGQLPHCPSITDLAIGDSRTAYEETAVANHFTVIAPLAHVTSATCERLKQPIDRAHS